MKAFGGRDKQPATLHRTWMGLLARLVLITVTLGALALAATQYQRSAFERTTMRLDHRMTALVGVDRTVGAANESMPYVIYGMGGPDKASANFAAYEKSDTAVRRSLAEADRVFAGDPVTKPLAKLRAEWDGIDRAVRTAPARWASGEVPKILAEGGDPWTKEVWQPIGRIAGDLRTARALAVSDASARVADVSRIQRLIGPLVLAAILIALLMSWLASRRLSRQIVAPLVRLRDAAVAMGDDGLGSVLELGDASLELHELAETLNATSISLRASHSLLHSQAHTDSLTTLPNRMAFSESLRSLLVASESQRVGVLFIDLDDFKVVNDSLGHDAGDELLRNVAERLRAATRQGDLVARLGGDEFAIAVPLSDAAPTAAEVAERVLATLEAPLSIAGHRVSVECSIGIAVSAPDDDETVTEELLRNADFAMYMAKSQGKNRFEVFAATMYNQMVAHTELKRELADALDQYQFELFQQPVVDLDTGRLLGFESLLRWQHPTRGLIGPSEFLSLAEETGEIVRIGLWTVDEACAYLAAYLGATPEHRSTWVSVNASATQLAASGFVVAVAAALDRHRLEPGSLVIEVTEAVAVTTTSAGAKALTALRDLGVHVALDDFGVGFSSLQHLSELPVDIIKIDRSFVSREGVDSDAMLEAIVTLGARLGLQVIAEGIEQTSERDRLTRLGASAGQGYLFARPMPAVEAVKYSPDRSFATPGGHRKRS